MAVVAATLLRIEPEPRLKHHSDFSIVIIAAGMAGLLVTSFLFTIISVVKSISDEKR